MQEFQVVFEIINQKNCPLYEEGETLLLSDKSLSCPKGKEACLILVRDLTQLLFQLRGTSVDNFRDSTFNCSGCTGLIKYRLSNKEDSIDEAGPKVSIETAVQGLYGVLVQSPFLQALPADKLEETMARFSLVELGANKTLIQKGEDNLNMYLILEGRLTVENNGMLLGSLHSGEICGEMSYLGADKAVATVKTAEPTLLLAIAGKDFGELFSSVSSVQCFMARLMADRLNKNNAERTLDFESSMSGRIDKIPPAELLQIFHMHQKTGVLKLDFFDCKAKVSFREGCIINAQYGDDQYNEAAIFSILAEKVGVYRFISGLSPQEMRAAEIGDFMSLLMEGVKRVDEAKQEIASK